MASSAPFSETSPAPRQALGLNAVSVMVVCALALTALGLTILFSASASFKQGPYYYLNKQIFGVVAAVAIAAVVSRIDLEWLRKYSWWILGITVVLLIAVLIPYLGIKVKGSRRWLGFGAFRLQVSEFAKLSLVFCLAHYLAINQTRLHEFKRGYLYPLGIVFAIGLLIAKEPDLGTAALCIAAGLTLLFLAGASWKYMFPTLVAVCVGFATLVYLIPNRLARFLAFLDVEGNKQGGTYQLYQSLAAFAAGGTEGAGLGQGRQQINFLPEAHTDFIFAVVGEELGMWATLGVVGVFIVLFTAGLIHLRRAPNLFQFLLASGCVMLIAYQAIINLGVVTGIFPTKGMSLPFISAGLSNLLLMGLLMGVLVNTQRSWPRPALVRRRRNMQEVV
ncbi:FtsW/RodA/SpoVE family cell cycle protein [Nibricoccus sp. IMCC34717]|uniref:FtsW/RodA/SpoVE family cell cycle protein n=1 Tax=Nibricoccus sp. IMCC34717 TaxID=3034021 RepID=UPI00384EEF81